MLQSRLRRDDEAGAHVMTNPKSEAADDYIDQLVRQIVDAAGVPQEGPAADTPSRIDLLQAHIEQLRAGPQEESEPEMMDAEPRGAVVGPLPDRAANAPRFDVEQRPPLHVPTVEPERPQAGLTLHPEPAGSRTMMEKPSVRSAGSSSPGAISRSVANGVDEVILQALEASGAAPQAARDDKHSRYPEPARRERGSHVAWLLVGAIVALLLGGSAVLVGQSFHSKISDLVENYWSDLDVTARSGSTDPNIGESPIAPVQSSDVGEPEASLIPLVAVTSIEQRVSPPQAPDDGQVADRLPNGLAEHRRMVRTYRVGPDGKIIFGPRVGS